jgi:hypothetical protein
MLFQRGEDTQTFENEMFSNSPNTSQTIGHYSIDLLRWGTARAEWANLILYYVKFFAESPAFDCKICLV